MGNVLLVRHGQAMVDSDDYDRQSPLGSRQSELLGAALATRGTVPDRVIHGGMRRQAECAADIVRSLRAAGSTVPDPTADPAWAEFDYRGVLAAHYPGDRAALRAEVARHPDPVEAFRVVFEGAVTRWSSGRYDPDYTETYTGFEARVGQALRSLAGLVGSEGTILVVSSAGTIASAVTGLLGGDGRTWYRVNRVLINTGVSTVIADGRIDGLLLRSLNDHSHLQVGDPSMLTFR